MSYSRLAGATVLFTTLLYASTSFATSGCKAKTATDLEDFFDSAIEANENFKRTVFAGDENSDVQTLRHDKFIEQAVIPCVQRASASLVKSPNDALMSSYLSVVVSYENLSDDTFDRSLGKVFANNPALVEKGLSQFAATDRKLIFTTLSNGWNDVKSSVKPSIAKDRDDKLEQLYID